VNQTEAGTVTGRRVISLGRAGASSEALLASHLGVPKRAARVSAHSSRDPPRFGRARNANDTTDRAGDARPPGKPPRTRWSPTRNLSRKRSMAGRAIEIARREGIEFRSVYLSLEDDGTIKMDAQDMGPTVEEHWGDDDYEFWVLVPPASVPKLAFELLREKFSGQLGAVDAFRVWCMTVPPASLPKLAFKLLRKKFSSRFGAVDAFRDSCMAVPPASLPKLAFKLLRKKFSGQLGAVDAFQDWCTTHDVYHEFGQWV